MLTFDLVIRVHLGISLLFTFGLMYADRKIIFAFIDKVASIQKNFYHFSRLENLIGEIILSIFVFAGLLIIYFIQGFQWFVWGIRAFINWRTQREDLGVDLRKIKTDIDVNL